MSSSTVDVLIVGAGPSGSTAGPALARGLTEPARHYARRDVLYFSDELFDVRLGHWRSDVLRDVFQQGLNIVNHHARRGHVFSRAAVEASPFRSLQF
jgi:hypothetical protein